MLFLQTIIPMPIYTSDVPSGPWTHNDTMLSIAIIIGFVFLQIVTNLISAAICRKNFLKMFSPAININYFIPFLVNCLSYIIYIVAIFCFLIAVSQTSHTGHNAENVVVNSINVEGVNVFIGSGSDEGKLGGIDTRKVASS